MTKLDLEIAARHQAFASGDSSLIDFEDFSQYFFYPFAGSTGAVPDHLLGAIDRAIVEMATRALLGLV